MPRIGLLALASFIVLGVLGCSGDSRNVERARSQVGRLADHFDRQTTSAGVYIRPANNLAGERDPWGTDIIVEYSQGGMAEIVTVTSAGPDRELHSADDVSTFRQSTNLKGVGQGIKQHAGEVAGEMAKGAVKGAVDGVKESVKEGARDVKEGLKKVLPKKKPDPAKQPLEEDPSP
ncbi:MAG: hypothetical protein AABP62_01545 [Planctomycetota bacterium]